ncbi:hypothetical protein GGTG_00421 [Gaeumannomyces tritici R3-111a-1]|uniref:Uncharacterized protein n=1 Tax=Gaeumannomyces tritici (strain R3-111a-1) TaxID=644352 RepID=J3NGN2_GAET3|nr:hypothetical protein GGTG_00421 [Gaeumannomyces tritici R3-111a-1]EJT80422.1 hypothetical protein GGTG_00421 [Gaeumannomyces tritici R3-111a-1]
MHTAADRGSLQIVTRLPLFIAYARADREALTNNSWTSRHIAILYGVTNEEYLGLLPESGTRADDLPEGKGHRLKKECDACVAVSSTLHLLVLETSSRS